LVRTVIGGKRFWSLENFGDCPIVEALPMKETHMKMNRSTVLLASACITFLPLFAASMPTCAGQEAATAEVVIRPLAVSTMDREIVPLVVETRTEPARSGVLQTDSVIRRQTSDGAYEDWLKISKTTTESANGESQSTSVVTETDRQGKSVVQRKRDEIVAVIPGGTKTSATEYRRNSSGRLVLDNVTTVTETKISDGVTRTERVEKSADVNGRLVPTRQVTETAVSSGADAAVITREIQSYDHVEAKFQVTARETASVKVDGNVTLRETEVREPTRVGEEVTARVVSRETKAADGTVHRETVEYGRSLYSRGVGTVMADPLRAQRKVVEREVRRADGALVTKREVYRRDVNGDWVAASFSTDGAGRSPN
jgi:hypothetical protein